MHTFLTWWFCFGFATFVLVFSVRHRVAQKLPDLFRFRGSSKGMQEMRKEHQESIDKGNKVGASYGLSMLPLVLLFDLILWPLHLLATLFILFVKVEMSDDSAVELLKRP